MSTTTPGNAPPTDASYHWTTAKARLFLAALVEFGRVGEAARSVGMGRQSAYRLRVRLGETSLFARTWDKALTVGRAARRSRATRKATRLPPKSDIFGLGR